MAERMKVSGPFMHIQIAPPRPISEKIVAQLKSAESSVELVTLLESGTVFRVPADRLLEVCTKLKTICHRLGFEIELDDCRS